MEEVSDMFGRRAFQFREKILLLVISLSMLITVFMSVIFYRQSSETLKENYRKTVSENLKGRAALFDEMMKGAYLTCVYAVTDDELKEIIAKEDIKDNSDKGSVQYEELFDILRDYLERNNMVQSIYCFLPQKDIMLQISAGSELTVEASETVHSWIDEIMNRSSEVSPFSPVFTEDYTSVIRRHLYTFGKEIIDERGVTIGNLFVNVDERRVYFSCLQGGNTNNENLYLINGSVIASTQAERMLGEKFNQPHDSMIVKRNMSETEYCMISAADETVITEDLKKTRTWSIFMVIILNVLLAIPVFLIIRHLMNPLKELEQSMNRIKEGDFSVRVKIYSPDEIGSISERFNEMVGEIERLIDELVTQKMLKKEAEIEALQYQITPHFMYNTLNSIKYAAVLQKADYIAELLQSFTELLRMSASDRGAFITVDQEIKMVKNYILLQQFRYPDSFSAEYSIGEGTERLYVPRLLIQPLVENAILHGIDHGKNNNRIIISVVLDSGILKIFVTDNGAGMTNEEIKHLMSGEYRSKFSGIGIHNILERLRLYYGAKGTLEYYSQVGKGTTAVIKLPATDDPEEYSF